MSDKTIEEVEVIRAANNKNWMGLLKLAYKHAPEETRVIMQQICINDSKVVDLISKL